VINANDCRRGFLVRRLALAARAFAGETSGNVAMMFGLTLLMFMLVIGIAVDYGRAFHARTRMQTASDMVALAIAKDLEAGKTKAQIDAHKQAVLALNLGEATLSGWEATYTSNPAAGTVTSTVTGTMPTSFLNVFNVSELAITTKSTVTSGTDYVEIAMVLDTTGSMKSNNKMTELKSAATSMLTNLANSNAGLSGRTSVAIVPFAVAVKVGTDYDSATWLGPKETSSVASTTQVRKCTNFWGYNYCWYDTETTYTQVPKVWTGCVRERSGSYTTSNSTPVATTSASLYPRYYYNSSTDGYDWCSTSQMLPLSTNFTTAKTTIANLAAVGNTNLPAGLIWGWNSLTPGAPTSLAETSKPERKVLKYMIVLSDGDNTQNTLGSSVSTIDANSKTICTGIKNAGITVFTIRVIDGNASLLKNCATTADYYYDVSDPATLSSVFARIMSTISKLRVSA
jgi:Flp pilus assembly protein TadG